MDTVDSKRRALLKVSGAGLALAAAPVLAKGARAHERVGSVALVTQEIQQGWQFKAVDSDTWMAATVPGTVHTDLLANHGIEDPFYRTNERDQQWIDKKDWEYQTVFRIDADTFKKLQIELVFEGLDTYADVYVNETKVLQADNMFREWIANIKGVLKPGDNTLRIYFHSPISVGLKKLHDYGFNLPATNDQSENGGLGADKVSVFTRKAGYAYGWDWGPRFVTSGVWRAVHIRAWNVARIENVQIIQESVSPTQAKLTAIYEVVADRACTAILDLKSSTDPTIQANVSVDLKPGLNRATIDFPILEPKLWWTNGLGEAHIYSIETTLKFGQDVLDVTQERIGVRTVKIVRKPDAQGSSFYIELNGVPVFMKGANAIPNDSFLPRVTHDVFEKVVQSAVDTHMNMIRVWGGGVYEDNYFYDLCDQKGILIWQDFMFACSMYPDDEAFLENVRQEAIDNVKRLRNHPCVALWVGNNEIDSAWQNDDPNGGWGWKQKYDDRQKEKIWKGYDSIFNKILPDVVATYDAQRFYWPSSPMADIGKHADLGAHAGDTHYWDVWWGQKPFSDYRTHIGRFMSEYGFQSFPEFETVKTYTTSADHDIFSEVMQAHQRSSIGNGTIKNYMQRDYIVPSDFEEFLYVGQVLQAEGIKTAMEAHRSRMPFCMGSLFWQINDCWPVASWSSIDYFGRWKAQQYFARKAFAAVLISPQIDDLKLSVYIVSDRLQDEDVIVSLRLMSFAGQILSHRDVPTRLMANTSTLAVIEDVPTLLNGALPDEVLLSTRIVLNGRTLADNVSFFTPVKNLALPTPNLSSTVTKQGQDLVLELSTDKLVKNLYLHVDGVDGAFSDNYFDLLPGERAMISFKSSNFVDVGIFESHLKMVHMGLIRAS